MFVGLQWTKLPQTQRVNGHRRWVVPVGKSPPTRRKETGIRKDRMPEPTVITRVGEKVQRRRKTAMPGVAFPYYHLLRLR